MKPAAVCAALAGLLLHGLTGPAAQAAPAAAARAVPAPLAGAALGEPSALCSQAITATERSARLPLQLLRSIALVESGRRDARTGGVNPWPWTINAEGTGFFFDTKDQAIAAVQTLQAHGVQSIDVGCLQVNLVHHAGAFASLEQAFEPRSNVAYAARFLNQLFVQMGTWPRAAAAYHSQTPAIAAEYLHRVMAIWPAGARYADPPALDVAPLPYTAEFAGRIAQEASERAVLYAAMRPSPVTGRPHGPSRQMARVVLPQAATLRPSVLALNATAVAAFLPTLPGGKRPNS